MPLRRRSDTNPEKEMPFSEHLEELRWHLLRSVIYLCVLFTVSWHYYDQIYALMATPVERAFAAANYDAKLVYMDILEPLLFRIQVVLTAAFIFCLPLLLWEIWRFVAPGLHDDERRFARPLLPFSILLCGLGCTLVYFALPLAFQFLLKFAPPAGQAEVMQHLQVYYRFLLRMMIGSAVTFQTPIVLLLLGQLEIVTSRGLVHFWRHAVLVCFGVAAMITPTIDPLNMSIIALPLCALYLLSVVLVWGVEVKRRRRAARETPPPDPPGDEPPVDPLTATPSAPAAKADLQPPTPPALAPAPTVVDRSVLGPLADTTDDEEPAGPTDDPSDEARFDPDPPSS